MKGDVPPAAEPKKEKTQIPWRGHTCAYDIATTLGRFYVPDDGWWLRLTCPCGFVIHEWKARNPDSKKYLLAKEEAYVPRKRAPSRKA
jgi:hypothetical protein